MKYIKKEEIITYEYNLMFAEKECDILVDSLTEYIGILYQESFQKDEVKDKSINAFMQTYQTEFDLLRDLSMMANLPGTMQYLTEVLEEIEAEYKTKREE